MTIDNDELPIVRKEPPAPMVLPERQIKPVLTDKEYSKLKFCYVTPDMGRNEIEPNIVYKDGGQIKFLLLPEAISGAAWLKATLAARAAYPNKGSRKADGQKYGRKLTLGWMKLRYPGYDNMRTAPTLEQPELVAAFYPLLREMDTLVENAVPDYHKYAWKCAMNAIRPDDEKDDLSRVADSHGLNVVEALDPWNMFYTIRGTSFSTVEFNHNIVFKAHEDGHNVDGTCVCITTLDSYAGGRLVFPRYGYSADLGPRDLVLCDNNHELHGNLGPIVGDRFSVVAFLHDSVMRRETVHDG
jgi:hypothetical protein